MDSGGGDTQNGGGIVGEPAKRRGPKPDSKPAQTRRQELNRQAQRTHRERKEQYIRTLETDISRLREGYSNDMNAAHFSLQQQREALQAQEEENNILKEILASNGIPYEAELARRKAARQAENPGFSQAGSTSGTHSSEPRSNSALLTTPGTTVSSNTSPSASGVEYVDPKHGGGAYPQGGYHAAQSEQPGISEYPGPMTQMGQIDQVPASLGAEMPGIFEADPQLGIEFILTLENPCRDHIEPLSRCAALDGIENKDRIYSGHALMACAPPPSHLETPPDNHYPHQTYDLPHANLSTLLNLSRQLVTDSQYTPIMALQSLKAHNMYQSLTRDDIIRMREDLVAKVRCYGFGAVVEDFEFMDSLSSVLESKYESLRATHQQIGTYDTAGNPALLSQTTNVLTYS
ncbi:hypothetical protein FQN54_009189 [Arachnomyces sp. PD_36]|nr:hypothetical protein FQN54_009189 [Arachnomyces sp. PD_36]